MSKTNRLSARDGQAGPPAVAATEDDDLAKLELELELRARLSIDPSALDDEFLACPCDTALLGRVLAETTREYLTAKKHAKRTRALVAAAARARLFLASNKPPTVDAVRDEVEVDSAVDAADAAEVVAEVALARAKTDFEAMRAKRDMLVQLGAARRAEWEADPVVRAHRRERYGPPGGK